MTIRDIMKTSPVIPVMVINDLDTAIPLAEALVAGGLRVLEITLRSAPAMDAIRAIAAQVPDAIVGVGTLTDATEAQQAVDAGATFAVSPGYTAELGAACQAANLPFLPGVMTPADVIRAKQDGLSALKFFPAAQAGGPAFLKALSGPFPDIVFCPTGGISPTNARDYLSLPNVLCVGGSWVVPSHLIADKNWQAITDLALECQQLRDH